MISSVTHDLERGLRDAVAAQADGEALGDTEIVVEALIQQGYPYMSAGRLDEARPVLEKALALSLAQGHDFMADVSRVFLGLCYFIGGDLDRGLATLEEARPGQIARGDLESGGVGLSFMAQITFAKGDLQGALELYRQGEAAVQTVGDTPEVARIQCEMGWTCLALPDLDAARQHFQRAVRTYDEVGSTPGTGQALMGLAATEAALGHDERALVIAAAAQELSAKAGVVVEHPMGPGLTERFDELRARVPEDRLAQMVASGGGMSPAEVLAMVGDPPSPMDPST
jgi:tetratricopeptide (TPR) repeat protein